MNDITYLLTTMLTHTITFMHRWLTFPVSSNLRMNSFTQNRNKISLIPASVNAGLQVGKTQACRLVKRRFQAKGLWLEARGLVL